MQNDMGRALVRGALAGVAGLVAMDLFQRGMKKVAGGGGDGDGDAEQAEESNGSKRRLTRFDDVSVVGQHHREGEPATVALGRLAYERLKGEEPTRQRGAQLGQAVHWGYGLAMGALFGLLESRMPTDDVQAGLGYGAVLWLIGDELAVPLLGLSDGPTAHPPSVHAQALGAHLVYGLATGAAMRALERTF